MMKVFISSVQKEFKHERQLLCNYIQSDPLLKRFFHPFLFENLPAADHRTDEIYLDEVHNCDIYIGIFGQDYGFEDGDGVSPTEREFNAASVTQKTRLVFVKGDNTLERHGKMQLLINLAGKELVRKRFNTEAELIAGVYAALVKFLEDKELIHFGPFDSSSFHKATLDDLDEEKIKRFLSRARHTRKFPLPADSSTVDILTHLNLIKEGKVTNAAILLFGKFPQRFFLTSEVKCAHFHGTEVAKPIPSYQVYKGDVFQLVDQAVDFVLSKINIHVGTREHSARVPVTYEIPPQVITEAIVNAVAHKDYTSKGSVQVMLFTDRLEVWNPGQLPNSLTLLKLREPHNSIPHNPLLAEPLYLTGYIERLGTGTRDMIKLCREAGLREPDYLMEDVFKTVIWRKNDRETEQVPDKHRGSTGEVPGKYRGSTGEVEKLIMVLEGELKRTEIQSALELKHEDYFREAYLVPALEAGFIEMTIPDKPKSSQQRYRLTSKGIAFKNTIT